MNVADASITEEDISLISVLRSGSLTASQPNEAAVRDRLRDVLIHEQISFAHFKSEFWVPCSHERADLAVIDDEMLGFEIKTARDNLSRLERQIDAYTRVFDRCTAVVAERHLVRAIELLPDWWGILSIVPETNPPRFHMLREATFNTNVDPEILVRLLWKEEARRILISLDHDPYPRASRAAMWRCILEVLDTDALRLVVRTSLVERGSTAAHGARPTKGGVPSAP